MSVEKKAYIIQTDNTILALQDRPTLAEAQKIVGGYIEFATGRVDNHNVEIVCNEEGLLEGLAKNYKATIYRQNWYNVHGLSMKMALIVGNVVILEGWKTVR